MHSAGPPDRRFPHLTVVRLQAGADGVLVSLVATLNLTGRRGRITFVHPVTNVARSTLEPGGRVVIRTRRDDGAVIDEFPVPVKLDSELSPGDDQTGLVDAVLPVTADARAIELAIDGHIADTFRVTGAPPDVRAIQPVSLEGQNLRVGVEFDRGLEDTHTYAVQVSADHGRSWQTMGVGLREQPFTVDWSQFPEGQELQLRVITTNGLSTSAVIADPFRVSDLRTRLG